MNIAKAAQALRDLADAIEEAVVDRVEEIKEEKVETPPVEKKAPKKKAAAKKKAPSKRKAKEIEPELEEKEDEDFGDDEEETQSAISSDEIRDAVKKYARENSRDAAYELLLKFGANKIAELKEKDYAKVMAEVGE